MMAVVKSGKPAERHNPIAAQPRRQVTQRTHAGAAVAQPYSNWQGHVPIFHKVRRGQGYKIISSHTGKHSY